MGLRPRPRKSQSRRAPCCVGGTSCLGTSLARVSAAYCACRWRIPADTSAIQTRYTIVHEHNCIVAAAYVSEAVFEKDTSNTNENTRTKYRGKTTPIQGGNSPPMGTGAARHGWRCRRWRRRERGGCGGRQLGGDSVRRWVLASPRQRSIPRSCAPAATRSSLCTNPRVSF